jgi:flagellar biosynthesis protein FlhG
MNSLAERGSATVARPRSLIVWGAMRDVGATTIAVNLAVELARHGRRVVLIDAEPDGAATRLCRLHEPSAAQRSGSVAASLADVYRGRRSLAAAISHGSNGVRVVANTVANSAAGTSETPPTDDEFATLAAEMDNLAQEADLVLVDAGWGDSPVAKHLAPIVDFVLVATTTNDAAVMEAYASIKRMLTANVAARIAAIVTRAEHLAAAENAFGRLNHGCRRFLGRAIDWAGAVMEDSTVADAAVCGAPFVVLSPRCEAAKGLQQAADYVQGAFAATHATTSRSPTSDEKHFAEPARSAIGEAA